MTKPFQIINGKVVSSTLRPETVGRPITRVVRTVLVTRVPGERIATIQLQLARGMVELEIDEATARALARLFD